MWAIGDAGNPGPPLQTGTMSHLLGCGFNHWVGNSSRIWGRWCWVEELWGCISGEGLLGRFTSLSSSLNHIPLFLWHPDWGTYPASQAGLIKSGTFRWGEIVQSKAVREAGYAGSAWQGREKPAPGFQGGCIYLRGAGVHVICEGNWEILILQLVWAEF